MARADYRIVAWGWAASLLFPPLLVGRNLWIPAARVWRPAAIPMRIIAGEHGGRRIAAPPGRGTRPMLDRVREALFSRIQMGLEGARVLDLFAGSGSLGLEALSRGAVRARMVERDAKALKLLTGNVETLGLLERAEIVRADALEPSSWTWADGSEKCDFAFVDAPYPLVQREPSCSQVLAAVRTLVLEHLETGGEAVMHVPRGALAAASFGADIAAEVRTYGTNDLWFLERDEG